MTRFARTVAPSCARFAVGLALIVLVAVGTSAVAATGAAAQETSTDVEFHPPEGEGTTDHPSSWRT